jgi:hypothetical protein
MAKAKQVRSWGDIPQETFEAFYKAVAKLREDMVPRDADGDHPIDIQIVNRMTHEPLGYIPVPRAEVYSYATHGFLEVHPDRLSEMEDETERALTANIAMATEALDRYMRLKQHRNWKKREANRPFAVRIREACLLCATKVGFADHEHDPYGKTREKYPDFPLMYHSHVVETKEAPLTYDMALAAATCRAFDLRRAEWRTQHPEAWGDIKHEEPRWCANPECRCKLPDRDSKKGVKDRNVCVNPRCGLDNSKHHPEAG